MFVGINSLCRVACGEDALEVHAQWLRTKTSLFTKREALSPDIVPGGQSPRSHREEHHEDPKFREANCSSDGAVFHSPACRCSANGNSPGVPVQMVVSVEAKHGNEIPMITQQDVIVHQGHNVRPVTGWVQATGNHAGLALAILIDDSAGISLDTQLNDIRAFIQEQAPTTLVAVGYMQNGTVIVTQNFTQDHMAAAKSVRLAQGYFGAEASPYLSLSDFIKRWPANPAVPRREVLMITSGIDTVYMGSYPNPYVDASVQDAQCAGIVVYSIYTPSAGHFGHSYWLNLLGPEFPLATF